jgi:hypothetical protein
MEYVFGIAGLLGAFGCGMLAEAWIRRGDVEHAVRMTQEYWAAQFEAYRKANRRDLLARAVNEAVAGGGK